METEHIASRFDKDLNKIKTEILDMGALVGVQLRDATEALMTRDLAEVDRIITTDRKINGMNLTVTKHSERLITLRQPMALDLREAMVPINIAGELERIGDHAKSTAKRARKLEGRIIGDDAMAILKKMSVLIQQQLEDVLIAYRDSDIEKAATIREDDLAIDALNKEMFAMSIGQFTEGADDAEALMHAVLISRNFERVGDHIVNITRYVIHIVTGKDPKRADFGS